MYNGFTVDQLIQTFIYDPATGSFSYRENNKPIVNNYISIRNPKGKKVTLYLSRVAVAIMTNSILSDLFVVKVKDGNPLNLSYNNLVVVSAKDSNKPLSKHGVTKTERDGVFYSESQQYFVVRRGKKQAIYRTTSFEEAVAVREEWEKDKSIHRWDFTVPLWFKPYLQ